MQLNLGKFMEILKNGYDTITYIFIYIKRGCLGSIIETFFKAVIPYARCRRSFKNLTGTGIPDTLAVVSAFEKRLYFGTST